MDYLSSVPLQSIRFFYTTVVKYKGVPRTTLEPLQVMVQLALLSTYPIGTKMCIEENIVLLQPSNILQPVARWYRADKKDDMYFLYMVIKRFIQWYHPSVNDSSPLTMELYRLICEMSSEGLRCLLRTYSARECHTMTQVLQMYQHLLMDDNSNTLPADDNESEIGTVFHHIVSVYEPTMLRMLYECLSLIRDEKDPADRQSIVDGLGMILQKWNRKIREWIQLHMVV